MNRLTILVGVVLLAVGPAPAKDIGTFKATYEEKLEEIVLSHGLRVTDLNQQYTVALDGLLAKVKQAGDLDKTRAVMNERDRFTRAQYMPALSSELLDIRQLQTFYAKQAAVHGIEKAQRVIALTRQFDKALERLQRGLVSAGDLDAAEAVQKERKRVQEAPVCQDAVAVLAQAAEAGGRPESPRDATEPTMARPPKRPDARSMKGLVLWYSFDKIRRNKVEDRSREKNHGKNHGGTHIADGNINGAILLDGKNDYISIADRLDIGGNNTVSVWVRVPLAGQADLEHGERVGVILGNNASGTPPYSNWEIWGNGQMGAWWNAGEKRLGPPPDLRDDRWHHLAWIKDKKTDTFTAYVDGELVATLDGAGADLRFRSKHRVGADNRSGIMPFFHGMLDELMIFDRALSPEELATLGQTE